MIKTKFVDSAIVTDSGLGPRQIRAVASAPTPDREGDVLLPGGCIVDNYRRNPIVLLSHDPTRPIGNAAISIQAGRVEALITFSPQGASRDADEICALAKAGVLRAVSVGFRPIESVPIDPNKPWAGRKFTSWELMELSIVAVPANSEALVIARSARGKSGRVLSGVNQAALAALRDRLDKSADCHDEALELLEKADRHRAAAKRHANAIAASADPGDYDGDGGGDGSAADDDDDDAELAVAVEQRKRVLQVLSLAAGPEPTVFEARAARGAELSYLDAHGVGDGEPAEFELTGAHVVQRVRDEERARLWRMWGL